MSHYLASALKSFLKNFIVKNDYNSEDASSILFSLDNNFLFYIFSHFESDSKKGGKEDEVLRSKFRRNT